MQSTLNSNRMDYSKSWTQSVTIYAGGITAVAGTTAIVAKAFNVELLQSEVEQIIYSGLFVVLGVMAIYGRIRAKAKIK